MFQMRLKFLIVDGCDVAKQELRRQLDLLLDIKLKDPQFDTHQEGKLVITAVLELLQSDGKEEGGCNWGTGGDHYRR